ncbi:MAG TPA: hypothetical protein PKC30_06335 [Saprospiraceae bacterium]|nr:hypothetical protein [Saprospiraceae bacterium]
MEVKDSSVIIALIEPELHAEVLRSFILSLHCQHIKLKVFTSSVVSNSLYDLYDYQNIEWFICRTPGEIYNCIENHLPQFKCCADVIWTSYPFLAKRINIPEIPCPQSVLIHNLHTVFDPIGNLDLSTVENILRIIKFLPALIELKSHKRISGFNRILLPSNEVMHYFLHKKYYSPVKPLVFQILVYEKPYATKHSTPIKITIPGTFSDKGRDYDTLFNALFNVQFNEDIEIVFLGKAGKQIPKKWKNRMNEILNKHNNINITTFAEFIPQKEYNEHLLQSDFLIIPLKKWKRYGPIKEWFGASALSGTVLDAVRFAIPALISYSYIIPEGLENTLIPYSNEMELTTLINKWMRNKTYNQIKTTESSHTIIFNKELAANEYLSTFHLKH